MYASIHQEEFEKLCSCSSNTNFLHNSSQLLMVDSICWFLRPETKLLLWKQVKFIKKSISFFIFSQSYFCDWTNQRYRPIIFDFQFIIFLYNGKIFKCFIFTLNYLVSPGPANKNIKNYVKPLSVGIIFFFNCFTI